MNSKDIHKHKKNKGISAVRRIGLSFLIVIVLGSILLSLPFSTTPEATSTYLDHLFVATSATCVTGLVTHVTCQEYTRIGQIIILILIQIGGLGFLTLMSMMFVLLKKKLSYANKIVMQEALNRNSLNDTAHYIKRVIKYTACFEILGMLCLIPVFYKQYGLLDSIYYGLFHSISAFCNAGFDLVGDSSLMPFVSDLWVNMVVCGLIIAGGLGFVVWIDIRMSWDHYKENFKVFKLNRFFDSLALHTRIVLTTTLLLIVGGMAAIFVLEYNNPQTIGNFSLGDKLLASFFQSVTLRTAGFATVDIASLTQATKLLCTGFMFIGGSPAGTAGGIKTVTFIIMCLYIRSLKRGEDHIHVFKRTIDDQIVKRSLTIALVSFFITVTGLFGLCISENADFINLVFEAFSAFATVGLSASITPTLSMMGKIVIIILMYIGRIGPITMVLIFVRKYNIKKGKDVNYISEHILIG